MRLVRKQLSSCFTPVLAGLMALLMFLLALLASSEGLHFRLHDNANPNHGQCAVCALVKGQLDVPACPTSGMVATLSFAWVLPANESALPPEIDFSAASTRGPPASVSFL